MNPATQSRERRAVIMLTGCCLIWGMGFNWNKQAQTLIGERLALSVQNPSAADFGPAAFLSIRFFLASLIWLALFPRSAKGWTRQTIGSGLAAGLMLAAGNLVQHFGLAQTSESLSAFLTSLTILFTPMLAVFVFRQRVSIGLWFSVVFAACGVALMTLFRENSGVDWGAMLGLLCAVIFSGHMLLLDHFGKRQDRTRFAFAQFAFTAAASIAFTCFFRPCGVEIKLTDLYFAIADPHVIGLLALTTLPGTILAFGLMFRFQPDMSATRAALVYLSEPIFATMYAWLAVGSTITPLAILGGIMILAGNVFAEFLSRPPAAMRADKGENAPVN